LKVKQKRIQGAEMKTDKLIEISRRKRASFSNQELTEGERQVIIAESESAINAILKTADEEKLAQFQEELNPELEAFAEYTQGLINEKKGQLLEGVITQEEYDAEISESQVATMETELAN
jgi:capsule polysaccharide export protein KpsE/RkpR